MRYPDSAASIYLMKNSKSVVRFVSLMLSDANKGRVVVGFGRRQEAWFDNQTEADVFVASLGGMREAGRGPGEKIDRALLTLSG